ncbi:MAG: C4-dicarboxylate TRAP transporter substrate-binding protein [Bauldia sp.]|nr:C4-dicarboxylate TRAP transporter substrate-binding protein [Bauldia sp.]
MNLKSLLFGMLAAAVASGGATAADYTLRLGHVLAPTDPLSIAAEGMKKSIDERTNGAVEVQIFTNSQLGDTQDMVDQAQAGANVGTFGDATRFGQFVPQFNVLAAPYAFTSVDQLDAFVSGPTFAKWNEELAEKTGLTILSFDWYQGARNLLTKKPVSTPADLAGQRIRTIGQPLWIATIGAMGAVPTPLAWAEVYPSIQTGAIDGAEAQPSAIWGAKLFEVVSDITVTEHIYLMSGLVVSNDWFKSLPEEYQAIVKEEAVRWGKEALKMNVEGADKIFADIEATGVKVARIDTTPFREAVKPVYAELGLTDLIAEVQKEAMN